MYAYAMFFAKMNSSYILLFITYSKIEPTVKPLNTGHSRLPKLCPLFSEFSL